jgi:hypothetical protein
MANSKSRRLAARIDRNEAQMLSALAKRWDTTRSGAMRRAITETASSLASMKSSGAKPLDSYRAGRLARMCADIGISPAAACAKALSALDEGADPDGILVDLIGALGLEESASASAVLDAVREVVRALEMVSDPIAEAPDDAPPPAISPLSAAPRRAPVVLTAAQKAGCKRLNITPEEFMRRHASAAHRVGRDAPINYNGPSEERAIAGAKKLGISVAAFKTLRADAARRR